MANTQPARGWGSVPPSSTRCSALYPDRGRTAGQAESPGHILKLQKSHRKCDVVFLKQPAHQKQRLLFRYRRSVKQIVLSSLDVPCVLSSTSRQKQTQNTDDPFFPATYSNWSGLPLTGAWTILILVNLNKSTSHLVPCSNCHLLKSEAFSLTWLNFKS